MIFCAEIGSMHKGIKSLAFELARQAAVSGADIAKFQLGHDPNDDVRSIDSWAFDLKEYCQYMGIEFMASIFSYEGLELAKMLGMRRYKIPSRKAFEHHSEDDYDEMCNKVMQAAYEVFWTGPVRDVTNVRSLWCITEYPTMPWQLEMPARFSEQGYYGFSDHTHGISASLLAIARGACYIERHFTLDKTEESIKDNHFASDPDEFGVLVREGRQLAALARKL